MPLVICVRVFFLWPLYFNVLVCLEKIMKKVCFRQKHVRFAVAFCVPSPLFGFFFTHMFICKAVWVCARWHIEYQNFFLRINLWLTAIGRTYVCATFRCFTFLLPHSCCCLYFTVFVRFFSSCGHLRQPLQFSVLRLKVFHNLTICHTHKPHAAQTLKCEWVRVRALVRPETFQSVCILNLEKI